MTPTIDVEVEDRAADKSTHVMRFSLSVIDGHAQLKTRDGEAKYDLVAHSSPSTTPHFALSLKRSDTAAAGDIELSSRDPPRSRSTRARCEDRSRRRKVHDHRRAGALTG